MDKKRFYKVASIHAETKYTPETGAVCFLFITFATVSRTRSLAE